MATCYTSGDLCVTLGAPSAQNLLDLGARSAVAGKRDQRVAVAYANLDNLHSMTAARSSADNFQETLTLPNAAASTTPAIDSQDARIKIETNEIGALREKEMENRQPIFALDRRA